VAQKLTPERLLAAIESLSILQITGPTKLQLAENLCVSDATVRKEVGKLVAVGLVKRAPYGYVVVGKGTT
jgi:Mn-dependent DtxR family transcriptional regulator